MKAKLTVLSLSPLCLLTTILNFNFITQTSEGQIFTLCQFVKCNILIILLLTICFLWCFVSILFYFYFKFNTSFAKESGYSIKIISEEKEAGLTFFTSMILPLLVGDLDKWQNAIAFTVIFTIIFLLLMKTNLFYSNPILTLMGYHVYIITFNNNPYKDGQIFAVTTDIISNESIIEYREIDGDVVFAKLIKNRSVKNET
ncbi:MAG: hypothetical protein FWD44_06955 [Oscillospiraceae bacterium]|nr:hypothetical protein [Oscillospiraceae bacterium]